MAEPAMAQNLSLNPTPMSQSIVNIQQPLAAPDPVGLAAALKGITTPNIFRDMSGFGELQQLFHDLIQGSITSAKKNIQAKQTGIGAAGGSIDASGGQGATDAVTSHAQVEDNRGRDQQVTAEEAQHAIKLAENQALKGCPAPLEPR
ncbi:hypothetical protein LTR57_025438 [Friedmanniomyces endolithicus]|nr:hypothetical protein LTR57_025438 [Friedmanniomyces endolithicus]